jgi:hypothetical protein
VRRACLIVWFLVSASVLMGAQQTGGRILTWTPPEHLDPPFPTQLRKMAVVIQLMCKSSIGAPLSARGTGFTVAYLDPRLPKDLSFQYLVTNRHVAECWDENRRPQEVTSTEVLVNMKDGSTEVSPLSGLHWYFSADQSADLAVTPLSFTPNVDHLGVPLDMFFTKDLFTTYNVGEGAKIILSGYFYQLEGERRVQPLIREGILSMIPEDTLETTTGKRGRLYLGDVHIFGGNSGSPVFISTAGVRRDTIQFLDDYRFLGVVSGYYYEDSDFNLQIATTVRGKQRANSGVSMIVPADILKDLILNNPDLQRNRDSNLPSVPPSAAHPK